jgi:hypothetical protein
MHLVNLSLLATLAGCFLSIGFLLWVLAGLVVEGKRTNIRYVVCRDRGELAKGNQHTVRFNLDHILAGSLRRTQGQL